MLAGRRRALREGRTHTKSPRKRRRTSHAGERRKRARVKQVTLRSRRRRGKRRAKAVVRTRPRRGGRGTNVSVRLTGATERKRKRRGSKRRKTSRKRRRKNPIAETPRRRRRRRRNPIAETPRRRRRSRRRKNPIMETRRHHRRRRNPLSGGREIGMGVLGLSVGALLTMGAFRFATTHPVSGGQDAPAAGQLYNAEAPAVPIWMAGWKALAAAGAGVIAPFWIASMVKSAGAKSFFQLAGFGGLAFVGTKTLTDVGVKFLGNTALGQRLLAPEIMARHDAQITGPQTVNTAMSLPGVAGLPNRMLGQAQPYGILSPDQAAAVGLPPANPGMSWKTVAPDANGNCPQIPGIVSMPMVGNLDQFMCYVQVAVPPPPGGGGGGGGGGGTPPGGGGGTPPGQPCPPCPPIQQCPPGYTPPPGMPGPRSPPYALSPQNNNTCCDSCARGNACSCAGPTTGPDWSAVLNGD
jgi:hypothetical protein